MNQNNFTEFIVRYNLNKIYSFQRIQQVSFGTLLMSLTTSTAFQLRITDLDITDVNSK